MRTDGRTTSKNAGPPATSVMEAEKGFPEVLASSRTFFFNYAVMLKSEMIGILKQACTASGNLSSFDEM